MRPLNDDLQRQLMALFMVEVQEHVQAMNTHLLVLEGQSGGEADARLLADTLREAHSLKGAARAVNLTRVESLAHSLESLFVRLQNGDLQWSAGIFNLTFQALDAFGPLVQEANGTEKANVDISGLISQLNLTTNLLEKTKPEAPGRDVEKPPQNPATPDAVAEESIAPPSPPSGQVNELPATEETVRVTTAKLDTLLSQMGELQVIRIGTEQRLVELHRLLETIAAWEGEWRKARPHYRRLLLTPETENLPGSSDQKDMRPVLEFIQMNEGRLQTIREAVAFLDRAFKADNRRMNQVAADLEEEIRQTRMLPVSTVFNAFPRMVRDLAKDSEKEAALVIQGGETNVDRSVLEQIKDPLIHLLRNCIDHGIEKPDVRQKAGKASRGTILLKAAQQGDSLVIEVSDDGAGIDTASVRSAAVKKHILTQESAAGLSEREAIWLIFRSGFSTSPIITDLSGRGVGLDIVRQHVEHLHGLVDVDTQPGQGTRFTLTVPLTVATTLCLLVQAGGQKVGAKLRPNLFALPITNVVRLIRVRPEEIRIVEGHQAICVNDEPMQLVHLCDVLGLDSAPDPTSAEKRPAIVIGAAEKRAAFLVDAVLGAQEMVIKVLPRPLLRVKNTAGATISGTGAVMVVLNATDLLNSVESVQARAGAQAQPLSRAEIKMPTIMVVDDSITTRTLEKNILEASGYRVRVAADGVEALTQLQIEACDLLVSDISMPFMDGCELTTRLRADEHLKFLPIILVTSLDSLADRERGVRAGADAYIVKSNFDQESLLDTIKRLI